jgi:hypothetical protein
MALLWPTLGQSKADGRVTVVTVCEVVDNPKLYADSPVAVVGGLESSGYLIDHYEFLFQGGCEHPVTSAGKVWPNKILIWPYSEEGFPKTPVDRPELRREIVFAKLSMLRKTTYVASTATPMRRTNGSSCTAESPVRRISGKRIAAKRRVAGDSMARRWRSWPSRTTSTASERMERRCLRRGEMGSDV